MHTSLIKTRPFAIFCPLCWFTQFNHWVVESILLASCPAATNLWCSIELLLSPGRFLNCLTRTDYRSVQTIPLTTNAVHCLRFSRHRFFRQALVVMQSTGGCRNRNENRPPLPKYAADERECDSTWIHAAIICGLAKGNPRDRKRGGGMDLEKSSSNLEKAWIGQRTRVPLGLSQ